MNAKLKLCGMLLGSILAWTAGADEIFKPADVGGAPEGRVGPGTRGTLEAVQLAVLAPGGGSQTNVPQPVLYWFCDRAVSNVNFQLSKVAADSAKIEPLFETVLRVETPGIQQIKLAQHKLSLEEGVQYEWSVSLPQLPSQRTPILALGRIKRVAVQVELATVLKTAQVRAQAEMYAEAGLWYSAFDVLQQALTAMPESPELQEARQQLLQQAGLDSLGQALAKAPVQ